METPFISHHSKKEGRKWFCVVDGN